MKVEKKVKVSYNYTLNLYGVEITTTLDKEASRDIVIASIAKSLTQVNKEIETGDLLFYTQHKTRSYFMSFAFALPSEPFNLTFDSTDSEIEAEFIRVASAYKPENK